MNIIDVQQHDGSWRYKLIAGGCCGYMRDAVNVESLIDSTLHILSGTSGSVRDWVSIPIQFCPWCGADITKTSGTIERRRIFTT